MERDTARVSLSLKPRPMLYLCKAEDGEVFHVNTSSRDIERLGSLDYFLQRETGVDEQAVLAFLSDGRRLRHENIRDLAGAQDQKIYVFNKDLLDYELEEVLGQLRVEAPLLPPIEADSVAATPPLRRSHLASSFLQNAHAHHTSIMHAASTIHTQHDALAIAFSSLNLNVLAITDTFEGVAGIARGELERQTALLAGVESDLRIAARVSIHKEFMSAGVRKAIESGEKQRTLGDYVSNAKMRQVAESCERTHHDFEARVLQCEEAMERLDKGTEEVRASVTDVRLLEDVDSSVQRSKDSFDRVTDLAAILESPASNAESIIQELRQLDNALRNELQLMYSTKNAYTEQCIRALRYISTLNNDLVMLPQALSSLQAIARSKNSFSHIQRLHNMLYAYGATVIEIVRRKEFALFFYQRAQSILEVMAKLSTGERKRRQVYKSEIHGQLPFDVRGMEDTVPSIDFSPSVVVETPYSLERSDVDAMLVMLDDLERYAKSDDDQVGFNALRECRTTLEKLTAKMDSLGSGFDKIAERSLLSASRLSSSRRRPLEADEKHYQELVERVRFSEEALTQQEARFRAEREALEDEIRHLKSSLEEAQTTASNEQERAGHLDREVQHVRAQLENELGARRIMDERQNELSADIESLRQALLTALADATSQTKASELLRQELAQVRTESEDVKELEAKHASKVEKLLEVQEETWRNLAEARARGEDLESQIQIAQAESADVKRALAEAGREKDRLLRLQASEHDRLLRDHIAEADGDRAVLEHQFHELQAAHEDTERKLREMQSRYEMSCNDAGGLKDELQRVEHELREARHAERVLREDLRTGRASASAFEQRLEASSRLIAQILDVAIAFRNSHSKALSYAQAVTAPPTSGTKQSNGLADSVFSSAGRHSIVGPLEEPSPIDPSDLHTALDTLRAYDHDHFLEVITKMGQTIRKWQKQCREYRERAKGKISFRNFAKGDLALFLPTRNSVSKPWAAFNVSFPHYFLKATGHLAEQLRTREWIVARITSITERTVNRNDPTSNPYGLGDGVKYYMLEVEDWTQQMQPGKRRVSSRKVSSQVEQEHKSASLPAPSSPLTPAPPEGEVEDSFPITRPNVFPPRTRSNSSPTAVPSSLSRLLAQAPPDTAPEVVIPNSRTPSPATPPPLALLPPISPPPTSLPRTTPPPITPPPVSPSQTGSTQHVRTPSLPSPLRPGSRASRMSTSSRFSLRGIPPMGGSANNAKATATTALSENMSSSISTDATPTPTIVEQPIPSPEGSVTEGMIPLFSPARRRTTSYHVARGSPLAGSPPSSLREGGQRTSFRSAGTLAHIASSLGVSFGRKRIPELAAVVAATAEEEPLLSEEAATADGSEPRTESPAVDYLKRF